MYKHCPGTPCGVVSQRSRARAVQEGNGEQIHKHKYTNEITKYKYTNINTITEETQTCVVSQQRRARAVQEGNGEALEVVMKLMTGTEHQV